MEALRKFNDTHIDEDCRDVTGFHENELFFNCRFDKLRGLTLKDCVLDKSTLEVESIADMLDFTTTINCHTFRDVTLSPLLLDTLLCLLSLSKGNDLKRQKLLDVVGKERSEAILRVLKGIE